MVSPVFLGLMIIGKGCFVMLMLDWTGVASQDWLDCFFDASITHHMSPCAVGAEGRGKFGRG